jgi:F0F1-type ATP synthase assembly protein I
MSPFYKATIAPRLLVLAGMLTIAATVFIPVNDSAKALMEVAGGAVALAGAIWFIVAYRRHRKT